MPAPLSDLKLPAARPLAPTPFDRTFWQGDTSWMVLADVAKIVLVYLLLRFLLGRFADRVLAPLLSRGGSRLDAAQAGRIKTLASLIRSTISYVLNFVFGIMLLRALRLDPIPLLTTASVAGLAVGFGAQKLVKDTISGFFILLEDQYGLGDFVTIGAVSGTVEEVGLRTTRLRDEAGRLYILSNGDISQVCNQSRGAVQTFVEIGLAAAADVTQATAVIDGAGRELTEREPDLGLAAPPAVLGLGAMDAAKLTLRVSCPVSAPARLSQAQIALRGLAHARLTEAGIALA